MEAAPEEPTSTTRLVASASELTGEVCHTSSSPTSLLGEPSQLNLRGSYFACLRPSKRRERHVVLDPADDAAVLGRDHIEIITGLDAAGAGHVLDDDAGLAGDEPVHVARDQAGVGVVAAARARAHHQLDVLALVEIGDGVGAGGLGCEAGAAPIANAVIRRRAEIRDPADVRKKAGMVIYATPGFGPHAHEGSWRRLTTATNLPRRGDVFAALHTPCHYRRAALPRTDTSGQPYPTISNKHANSSAGDRYEFPRVASA